MEPFDDLREFAKSNKFALTFWTVLVMLLILFIILFFWVEHITLTVNPGENITFANVPSYNTSLVTLGSQPITVDYSYGNSPDFIGFLCEDGVITGNWVVSDGNTNTTVKNNCSETITIEVYSYSFRLLNAILDASNGQLRMDSGSD